MGGTAKLTNRVTISGTFNHVTTNVKSPPTSTSFGSRASNTSLYGDVMYTPTAVDLIGLPWENPLDHSHVYYRNGNDIQNPLWTLHNSFTEDKTSRNFGNIAALYDVNSKIKLLYRFGYDDYSNYQLYAQNKGGASTPLGILRTSTGFNAVLAHTLTANYKRDLNNDFNIDVLDGATEREES